MREPPVSNPPQTMSEQVDEPNADAPTMPALTCASITNSDSTMSTGAAPAEATEAVVVTTTTTANVENYDVTTNGHLSPTDGLTNGIAAEHVAGPVIGAAASSGQNFITHGHVVHSHNGDGLDSNGGNQVNSTSSPAASCSHGNGSQAPPRGHSPNRYSPNTTGQGSSSSRGNSPTDPSATTSPPGQHVVHVHINPGETFSVRMGDQIQHIPGPATVRMVSNNGPPLPMPMQVPPGHMVQQIVDENGILTHVILSPQLPGMHGAPIPVGYYGGPNSSGQQMYPPYGPQYPTYPQYPPHHHPHHGGPPHMHPVPPHHVHGSAPTGHQCNSHSHSHPPPHGHAQGPPPPHHNHTHISDERAQRTKQRLQEKLHKRQRHSGDSYYNNIPSSPSRRSKPKVNSDSGRGRAHDTHSSSSSTDGHDLEEERRALHSLLCKMSQPKISDVEPRSALIELTPPECSVQEFDIDASEFKYELLLSDKGKEGKGKVVYSGDATEITLQDLKPATEYFLRVSARLDDLRGNPTDLVSFKTQSCEPEKPQSPKLSQRTKTSLLVKWNTCIDNGSKILHYKLEFDQGRGDGNFVEVYSGLQRQHKVTKLSTSTRYVFRLAACNNVGKSEYCDPVCFCTSGSVPSQPDPPMLSEQFVKALTVSWIKRPNDDEFTLQMEDESTGHGFLTMYNGPDLSHTIKGLTRNTEYRFRLTANNEEGKSKWSDIVTYRTCPDRPGPPAKPQIKGKVHATDFRVVWDSPKDVGGSEIKKYVLELDDGRGFDVVYEGVEREFICDHLVPGHLYRLRACCISAGGRSDWSEMVAVTTLAICPGQCQAPKLQGKPKATMLHLRWGYPDYDGGSQVTEFEILMSLPDNSTREVYRGRDLDCTVAGLSPGRPYLFQVRAVNKAGAGPWSDSLEVVSGAGVPDPPKLPTAHCKSPHSVMVVWEDPVNNGATITDYRLEWQQRAEADFTQLYLGSALSFEVKGLTPATVYSFRVQALNSAGAGAFSSVCSCQTPPSSPGPVVLLRPHATANSIHIMWKEPNANGSKITQYNLDIGERHLITVEKALEYEILDLLPETTYKIRIQAVNEIGVGPFSSPLKVVTRSLPPAPPRLECISSGPNSLKLKWGDGKNPDLLQYVLEMLRDNGSFYPIYNGPSNSHKVNKLCELTPYEFRIYASNEAGDGPYSSVSSFKTTKAPPPAVKAPKISELSLDKCLVEWQACKPMGRDTIIYALQLQHKDQEYREVYKGVETSYKLTGLTAKTDYQVRVCAVRQCNCDDAGDLSGAFSPGVPFTSLSLEPVRSAPSKTSESKMVEVKQFTDQQWAIIILLVFALLAGLVAIIAQHFLL